MQNFVQPSVNFVMNQAFGSKWALYHADCVPAMAGMPDDSIDFTCTSCPFGDIYIYSDSEADLGNVQTMEEFAEQYAFSIRELFRITRPGRLAAVHVKDLPLYKGSDGWFGIEDFSGLVSYLHRRAGFVFHSRITLWKDPVAEMEKTNSHGLLHKNFAQRAQVVRVGLPDYLMVFAKPDPDGMGKDVTQLRQIGDFIGTEPPPAHEWLHSLRQRTPDWYTGDVNQYNYSIAVWQRYASPVWFDYQPTDVLNVRAVRDPESEKHLCPMPLSTCARAIDLWTNKDEVVFDPFTGIGSTGVEALRLGRRFVGTELKAEYWAQACKHLADAELKAARPMLPGFESEAS